MFREIAPEGPGQIDPYRRVEDQLAAWDDDQSLMGTAAQLNG